MIHVCSLARLHDTVRETRARHVVTLIKDITLVHRPPSISAENHLLLDMDDINEHIDGYVVPGETHVGDLLRFVRAWPREAPLVVHCYAGISRSTAGAFVTACALNPQRDEKRSPAPCAPPRRPRRRTGASSRSPTEYSAATAAWSRRSKRSDPAWLPTRPSRSGSILNSDGGNRPHADRNRADRRDRRR